VALRRVDLVVRAVVRELVRDRVEHEELALRAEVRGVGDPGRAQVLLGALGHAPRVLGVRLPRQRVDDLAQQRERRRLGERVEDRGLRLRHEEHVALRDPLPAADRRAVEAEPVVERALVEGGERQGHVLPGPEEIRELEVDHLRLDVTTPLECGGRRRLVAEVVPRLVCCHLRLLRRTNEKSPTTPTE
jgi:hypothetical protein